MRAERVNEELVRNTIGVLAEHIVLEVFYHALIRWCILNHFVPVYLPIDTQGGSLHHIPSHFFKDGRNGDHEVQSRANVLIIH